METEFVVLIGRTRPDSVRGEDRQQDRRPPGRAGAHRRAHASGVRQRGIALHPRRPRPADPARECRHGDVPCQRSRAGAGSASTPGDERAQAHRRLDPRTACVAPSPRAAGGALPVPGVARGRTPVRGGGAGAPGAIRARGRSGPTEFIPIAEGDRPDRSARRTCAAHGLPARATGRSCPHCADPVAAAPGA